MIFLLFIASVLLLLAGFSIRRQLVNLKRMRSESHIPSDDRAYFKSQAYRRLATGLLMIVLAGMLAGTYLSGMERWPDELAQKRIEMANGQKAADNPDDKAFARFYLSYWIGILVLLFIVVSLAIVDLWSTRRYAWQQLRRIQSENRAMLERDLAMHRQQKLNDRMRKVE